MERGAIDVAELPGGLDLQSTLESGQSYRWRRDDGRTYADTGLHGGAAWYHTVVDGEVIRARQHDGTLEWESTTDAVPYLTELLRLEDDLEAIVDATPADPLLADAYDAYPGMRIVADPFFPCLVSFICSAQMRVERIFAMQEALAAAYGDRVPFDGETYRAFPTPDQLAGVPEAELRELGLGYRAPYVEATASLLADGELTSADLPAAYEPAREALTGYVGVGQKVADCVCLFSLGHLEAVPLDTWIRSAIAEHYPDCDRGRYDETSRAIRERFGPYAGYAQTYVFHYLRHRQ
ncbi:MAG: DNA-3-methyladenine glycosylase [Halobacteriales archaeon]|nr:DNA-3-methyladenine glycosylase [Halobacteriales archaeon]